MKIIFLDIDGVLNHQIWFKNWHESGKRTDTEEQYNDSMIDPNSISLLNKIIADTGAKVVISSSWRKNNTVETKLGLKHLAAEFAGNYGEENIKNTELIPLPDLLTYNLKDCLCTWYVYNKYNQLMQEENQSDIYTELLRPGIRAVLQMELCGMPINMSKVKDLKHLLADTVAEQQEFFRTSPIIQEFHYIQLEEKAAAMRICATLKLSWTKSKNMSRKS